jgi:AraC-like DNA-binding protein
LAAARDIGAGALEPADETGRRSWIRRSEDASGLERIEAFFDGRGYEMHRHDTYAIGITLAGVQSFQFRGAIRNSPAGSAVVLHPDEKHDGQAGAEGGFRYRTIYIEPAAIQAVLQGRPLPFIAGAVSDDPRLVQAARRILRRVDDPIERFECEDALYDLALALEAASGSFSPTGTRIIDYRSAETVRDYLHTLPPSVTMAGLERLAGRDRWSLSRDFRALFGTSPYRYLVLRRLDAAKTAIQAGCSLVDTALDAGFSDQSHMTRQFTAAFGLPPSRWLRLQRR